ncbi:MAG TPA: serine/threonine-protein kinase [Kofleriaceae bacterium]|nr:serine/threonine-protein kinase [Kofleriaceae bacterium]
MYARALGEPSRRGGRQRADGRARNWPPRVLDWPRTSRNVAPEASVVGAVIGNYQLIRKLGQGGMGVVYLGQHTLLGRRAAIKVLLPTLSARSEIVHRFFNEARAVTSVSDPGIVQVFDFGYHSDDSAFIIMEYLEGEPLDRRLERLGRLPALEALRLGRQLASSLAAAHAQQIIHRDLKPENIFLVHDAEVAAGERTKILDFGIAKLSDNHPSKIATTTGMLMGTPRYMSPEQCRGVADIDHRSDIYALGCVLFHLLTGKPPFDGEGPGDIISAHIREPAPSPSSRLPELSPAVDALVVRCLAKSPGDRFQSMADVTAAIGQMLQLAGTPALAPIQHLLPTTKVSIGASPVAAPPTSAAPAGAPPSPEPHPPDDAPPSAPRATTLGASSGQLSLAARRRRTRWVAALAAAAAVAGIAIVFAVPRGTTPESIGRGRDAVNASTAEQSKSADAAKPSTADASKREDAANTSAADPSQRNDASSISATGANKGDDAARAGAAEASNGGDPLRTSAGATSGDRNEPGKRVDAHADSRRRSAGVAPASTKTKAAPGNKVAPAATTTSEPGSARRTDHPAPPPEPAAPPTLRCSKAAFAAVYNAAAPPRDEIHAALRNLNACRAAGSLTEPEYEQTRDALVARL